MIKKLSAVGHELMMVIDEATLRALKIDQNTPLDVRVVDGALVIRPALEDRDPLLDIADTIMDLHDDTFRKLAQ